LRADVIFGWGEICPDAEMTAFILDGNPPVTETCDGDVVGIYQPLFSAGADDDPETVLDALEWEISYLSEYYYWDARGLRLGERRVRPPRDDRRLRLLLRVGRRGVLGRAAVLIARRELLTPLISVAEVGARFVLRGTPEPRSKEWPAPWSAP
jgi:hypothetical protein